MEPETIYISPCCKSHLSNNTAMLICNVCGQKYTYSQNIFNFIIPTKINEPLLKKLRLKSKEETKKTIQIDAYINYGFLNYKFLLVFNILWVILIILGYYFLAMGIIIIECIDWIYFRIKRKKYIEDWKKSELIAQKPEDFAAIEQLTTNQEFNQGKMLTASKINDKMNDTFTKWKTESRYRVCAEEYMNWCGSSTIVGEIGAGDGIMYYQFGFGKGKQYYGIDVNDKELEQLVSHGKDAIAVKAFGEDLPFRDNYFDLLLCTETLEHFPFPQKGLSEFNRVLKPNGFIIITVPNATYLRNLNPFHMLIECSFGQYINQLPQRIVVHENMWSNAITHHHDFTKKDVQTLSQDTNLKIIKCYSTNFPFPYISLLKRANVFNIIETIGKKTPLARFWGRNLVLVLKKLPG